MLLLIFKVKKTYRERSLWSSGDTGLETECMSHLLLYAQYLHWEELQSKSRILWTWYAPYINDIDEQTNLINIHENTYLWCYYYWLLGGILGELPALLLSSVLHSHHCPETKSAMGRIWEYHRAGNDTTSYQTEFIHQKCVIKGSARAIILRAPPPSGLLNQVSCYPYRYYFPLRC